MWQRGWQRGWVLTLTLTLTLALTRRVALLNDINEADNRIFTRFFNAMINNEAVRSFTNEPRASTPAVAALAAARAPRGYPLAQGCPLAPRRAPSPLGSCRHRVLPP